MNASEVKKSTERMSELIWERDGILLGEYIESLPSADLALVLSRLDSSDGTELLSILDPVAAANLLPNFTEPSPAARLAQLAPEAAAAILHELPSNIETDYVAAMKPNAAERILELMPKREMNDIQALARYAPDVAGGLMATEILSYNETDTVEHVVEDLRKNQETYSGYNIQYIYVTGADRRLAGVMRIRDLLLSRPETALSQLVGAGTITVEDETPLEELRDIFDRHGYLGLPVVKNESLVGVVRRAAVEEALAQKTARQFRLVQGIIGGEEVRTLPVRIRAGRRLAFLSANIVLNIVAASVIVYFEETLASLIALAAFLPIISDMSGCSGNQAVAVSMRELSLGLVRPREVLRVLVKEIQVGLANGAALGVLLGLVAWLWRGSPTLGLVVGAALALNTVVAVSIGGAVPLVLKRVGIDPALASGPILTTVTDICGFFFALGLAAFALAKGFL